MPFKSFEERRELVQQFEEPFMKNLSWECNKFEVYHYYVNMKQGRVLSS